MSQQVPDKSVKLPFLAVPRRCPQRGICGEGKSLAGGFFSGFLTCTGAGSCWKSPSFLAYKMLSVASLPDPRSRLPVFSGAGICS